MKEQKQKCCICGQQFNGYANNPAPVTNSGRCCDECNRNVVIPVRLSIIRQQMKKLFTFILMLFALSAAKAQDINMTIKPNPATDSIVITTDFQDTLKVSIYDIMGKLMMSGQMTGGRHSIKTDTLQERGLYWVKLYNEADDKSTTNTVIIK